MWQKHYICEVIYKKCVHVIEHVCEIACYRGKNAGLVVRRLRLKSQISSLLPVRPWATHFTAPGLIFLICKMMVLD